MTHLSGTTVHALFERAFRVHASRTALTFGSSTWTYREVGERSRRLSAALAARGLGRGSRVAVLSETRPEYVETYAGLAAIGTTLLTLNIRMHPDEIAWCVETGRPSALFVSARFADHLPRLRQVLPDETLVVCLDGSVDGATSYEDLLAGEQAASWEEPRPDDIHVVLYTSGTTGRPKGAMISQSAAATRGLRLAQWFALTPEDGFVGWVPMFHCAGDESLYATFLTGGTFATLDSADPLALYEAIEQHRLTWTLLLPGVITTFLDDPRRADHDLSTFRFGIGYANMMPRVVERLTRELDACFYDAFGQTETSYLVAHGIVRPGEPATLRKTPAPLLEVRLVDPEGREVPIGTPGECVVRGPSVMSGYLDDAAATEAVFAGGWLHTGDVLVADDDGLLKFVDRTKFLIKTGGENVYPAEVEAVLTSHPDVVEACVYGVPDEHWGETVKAVVVARDGTSPRPADLDAWCRERLGGYQRPRYLQLVSAEEIPRSTTGKVMRHELAKVPPTEDQRL